MTYRANWEKRDLLKVQVQVHSSPGRGFRIHINLERNSTRNIMQAKQLCTNQKSTEVKELLPVFVLLHREGRWLFSSAHPLRNNPAAKLTDLTFLWVY